MGLPFATLFGDKSKEEIRKEIEKIDAEIAKLQADKEELKKALEE